MTEYNANYEILNWNTHACFEQKHVQLSLILTLCMLNEMDDFAHFEGILEFSFAFVNQQSMLS